VVYFAREGVKRHFFITNVSMGKSGCVVGNTLPAFFGLSMPALDSGPCPKK
jgi:hypothetical protein